ncbi:MAG: lantibiotic immunity ABC transporter MutE/EpiE family permease subunit [Lachnospiraceae bacterium]|nr:lantibiotic immunity ABC transporter MutE/EpiE family permease subunit [Lachnospiraceae bacterium]
MKYLKSEHLKFKRTISNKLLWIAPLFTALFAWICGGFFGFQYMTFYWWYAFLLPGTIAILCALSHQKEERAGKYYAVFSLPLNLKKFETAKAIVLIEKLVISALFLAVFASIGNLTSPATAVYSIRQNILGSLGIALASIWLIPLCLYLTRKTGMVLAIILNAILGISVPTMLGNRMIGWLCPYCWAAKLADPLIGIKVNGTFSGNIFFSGTILLALLLSVLLFGVIAYLDAKDFENRRCSKWG